MAATSLSPAASAAEAAVAVSTVDPASEPQLDATKLHVYHVALELHVQCSTLVSTLHRVLRDQLERASLSVVLNTAEAMVPHYLLEETSLRKEALLRPASC